MSRRNTPQQILIATLCLTMLPALAGAQVTGIAGVVKDTSGGVLPGVTVEASSPALIERVRTAVTDSQGQYKIVDLLPGVYTVAFTLPGFSTARHEGVTLTASFTATVNPEMTVGAVTESVTVSGQSPMVDVQNVVQQRVISAEVIAAIPSARSMPNLAAVVPGVVVNPGRRPSAQDVGGSGGTSFQSLAAHGGRNTDQAEMNEGLPVSSMNGLNTGGIAINSGSMQEFSYQLGALSAESPTGGVQIHHIPKDGGNTFSGSLYAGFANSHMQNDNFSDRLKATGLSTINRLDKVWDLNPTYGGPLVRNKLWFLGSMRYWGYNERVAGVFWAKDPAALIYVPDTTRPAFDDSWFTDLTARLTWQATPKNKVNLTAISQSRCVCHSTDQSLATPEASYRNITPLDYLYKVTWSAPATNRLLFEAGVEVLPYQNPRVRQDFTAPDALSISDSTGLVYHAPAQYTIYNSTLWASRAAVSYVTGSHAAKFGYQMRAGHRLNGQFVNGSMTLSLRNGVPSSITEYWSPRYQSDNLNSSLGLFAQDQWTVGRVTLNGGIRFDYHNASVAEQRLEATRFVGARDFAAVPNVPNWKDVSPRIGASWNVFGSARTAVKATLGRYVASETLGFANANNPVITSVVSANRTWTDLNGNFLPDCDFTNTAINGECGVLGNQNFGRNNPNANRYDPALQQGYGIRGFNWEVSTALQQELLPQLSVNVSYFRRWYGNFTTTDNQAVTTANYDHYCISAPVDSRLPGNGGYQICGLYDLNSQFGVFNNLVTFAKSYGKQMDVYNGVDVTMSARLAGGAIVQGGLNAGRSATNNCDVVIGRPQLTNASPAGANVTLPRSTAYCDVTPPLNPQVKFLASYPLPWDFQVSGTFQSIAGPQLLATYTASNAETRPSLGRNLASGANGTVLVDLIAPGTLYGERLYQLDLRLSRLIRVGPVRVHANIDAYNALNGDTILLYNNNYTPSTTSGPGWLQPRYILPGRLFKVGVQLDF